MQAFKRTVHIADAPDVGAVFLTVDWDGKRLSMTGVEGPKANGDARGSCGQISSDWGVYTPQPGVDLDRLRATWDTWHLNDMRAGCEHQRAEWDTKVKLEIITYRLTREAQEEQRKTKKAVEKQLRIPGPGSIKLTAERQAIYSLPFETKHAPDAASVGSGRYEVQSRQHSAAGWVRPDEHPGGLLGKPCPVCGYEYGTKWLHEDVPEDVIEYLAGLPKGKAACPTVWLKD